MKKTIDGLIAEYKIHIDSLEKGLIYQEGDEIDENYIKAVTDEINIYKKVIIDLYKTKVF